MNRLVGKVASVTVGAQGIGRATCEGCAREGTHVAVADKLSDEIAGPFVLLASPEAMYFAGRTMNVDGGNWMS